MVNSKLASFKALPIGLAIRLIALSLVRRVFKLPVTFSYAQGAEDMIVSHIARYQCAIADPGHYVDVGCNSPIRFSNTFAFYLRGWRGINIDANAALIRECQRIRKRDISICAAVSDSVKEVTFHKGKDDAVSTIDEERIVEWKKHFEFSDDDRETVVTRTLSAILDECWPFGNRLDLLTIDVEGHDLQVLKGLDFEKYRPKMIVIEMHEFEGIRESEIYKYLVANGYSLKCFAVLSAYFVDAALPSNKLQEG